MLRPLTVCSLWLIGGPLTALAQVSALDAVKGAEFSFAADALKRGTKAAFLATMHDSAIVFREAVPARAKSLLQSRPDPKADDPKLRWAPAAVGVSAQGDLGYTTGPWILTAADGKTTATGQFFTIWERQPDGTYKWLLDNGISFPSDAASGALPTPEQVEAGPRGEPEKGHKNLPVRTLDEELAADMAHRGVVAAYASRQHPNAQFFREGQAPLTAPADIWTQLQQEGDRRLVPAGGQWAAAHDLAYTYGRYFAADSPADKGAYAHLWLHTSAGWQLVFEITNPAPSPAAANK